MMTLALPARLVATFSIVAVDPGTEEIGVAVASKFIAVGAVVPWAKAEVGAVATQAMLNPSYGPDGLRLLESGIAPQEVLDQLMLADAGRDERQAGIVDTRGCAATFTGKKCIPWAGGLTGAHYCVQGNCLAGPEVLNAMARTFEGAGGEMGDRLIAALMAGQKAGGDARGKQAAALLVVHKGWGFGGFSDRYRDLRVDDHAEPIDELQRIYRLHKQTFPPPP